MNNCEVPSHNQLHRQHQGTAKAILYLRSASARWGAQKADEGVLYGLVSTGGRQMRTFQESSRSEVFLKNSCPQPKGDPGQASRERRRKTRRLSSEPWLPA